ncbi:RNI-like protein [Martensiomyces pterosporus]|nr:RNI-like protein [Martensiomyces pterosporus]
MGLDDRRCEWLGEVVEQQPYLRKLNVSNNLIGPQGVRRLLAGVSRGCPDLVILDLSSNLLRSEGAQHVANYLKTGARVLEQLDVSSNQIPHAGGRELIDALRPVYKSTLRLLNMDMNQLEAFGCRVLGRALAENTALVSLSLARNNIFDDGCQVLFEGLARNTTLKHLVLSGNAIGNAGAQAIRQYLRSSTALSMSNRNRRQDADAVQAACLHEGLISLNLSANMLRDDGVEAICEGLKENQTILHLHINHVDMSDAGAASIRQLLESTATKPTALLSLSLRHNNHVTTEGYSSIVRGCQANRHILRIKADLYFEGWSDVWDGVERAVIRNTRLAIERYTAPLLMVARGRLLLHAASPKPGDCQAGFAKLPVDIRIMIVMGLDALGVLRPQQKRRAVNIALDMTRRFPTRLQLLAAILESDYQYVRQIITMLH